jgi:hypothetical protein
VGAEGDRRLPRARTSPEAIDLVSRLLEYTPSARITPLQACAHTFFDELREPGTKLPSGRELPVLFNFTEQVAADTIREQHYWLKAVTSGF